VNKKIARKLTNQRNYSQQITALSKDRKGNRFAIGYSDGTFAIMHFTNGRMFGRHKVHEKGIINVILSGTLLITKSRKEAIRIWDLNSKKLIKEFKGIFYKTQDPMLSNTMALDHADNRLVFDGKIYSLKDDKLISETLGKNHHWAVLPITFDPSDRYLVFGHPLGRIGMWDLQADAPSRRFDALANQDKMKENIDKFRVDSRLKYLVTKVKETASIWDLQALKTIRTIKPVYDFQMAPEGNFLVTNPRRGKLAVWDLKTGNKKATIRFTPEHYDMKWFGIDPEGKYIVSTIETPSKEFKQMIPVTTVWSPKTGKPLNTIQGLYQVKFDPTGKTIIGLNIKNRIEIWDLSSHTLLTSHKVKIHKATGGPAMLYSKTPRPAPSGIFKLIQSPRKRFIILASLHKKIHLLNVETGELIHDIQIVESERLQFDHFKFSPEEDYFYYMRFNKGEGGIWSTHTGNLVCTIDSHKSALQAILVNSEKQKALSLSYENINVWDLITRKVHHTIPGAMFRQMMVDPDWRRVAATTNEKTMIYDLDTGILEKTIVKPGEIIELRPLHPNTHLAHASLMLSKTENGTYEVWNPLSENPITDHNYKYDKFYLYDRIGERTVLKLRGKYLFYKKQRALFTVQNLANNASCHLVNSGDEWIAYTSEGYFDSSKRGGTLVTAVKNLASFSIDQLSLRHNRPDIILSSMGFGNEEPINHFYNQHQKRFSRLGIQATAIAFDLHAPKADIMDLVQNGGTAKVICRFQDDLYPLEYYNIYLNDVPLFGLEGKKINNQEATIEEVIQLSAGKNKIEATCINSQGIESFRPVIHAHHNQRIKGDLYYIGFGASSYRDESLNLGYAAKDAVDMGNMFKQMKGAFGNIRVKTFLDEQVSKTSIDAAERFLRDATIEDTVVIFLAGHGLHDLNERETYYYLVHNSALDNLSETAVSFDKLESFLCRIKPRKKKVLLDTCESGEIDDTIEDQYFARADVNGFKPRTARSVRVRLRQMGKRPKWTKIWDHNRYIYNDLSRKSGAVVFSSSQGGELSYESDEVKNGFFTKGILEAFSTLESDSNGDKYLSIVELLNYVADRVSTLSANLQHPTIDRDNIYQQYRMPLLLKQDPTPLKARYPCCEPIPIEHLHWYIGDEIRLHSENRIHTGVLNGISDIHYNLSRTGIPHSNIIYADQCSQ